MSRFWRRRDGNSAAEVVRELPASLPVLGGGGGGGGGGGLGGSAGAGAGAAEAREGE